MRLESAHPAEEAQELRRCISDLAGILALPGTWSGAEPAEIGHSLLEALLGTLDLQFAFLRLRPPGSPEPVELFGPASAVEAAARPRTLEAMLDAWLAEDPLRRPAVIPVPGTGVVLAPVALGVHGELGALVVGSRRPDFPSQTDRLLLSVAANQAAIGLKEAALLSAERRIARELDERVARRTSELAAANEQLRLEVAERQRAEDAVRAQERNLVHIINTIPVLAWCNLPDGSNEYLNQPWHDYTGLAPGKAHGWGWQVAIHPDDLPRLLAAWRERLASGEPGEIEARLRRHDGVYRWFLFRVNPLRNEAGRIVKWYGTNTDIEDLKRAEEELRRKEAFLAEAQRLSLTGSFAWKVATDEITWSRELYRLFALDPELPVTFEQIFARTHPDDRRLVAEVIEAARGDGGNFEYEQRLVLPDGAARHVHVMAHAARSAAGELEYIGAVQDITAQRLSEAALDRARSDLAHVARAAGLGALTASIAHEVNQPLSGIVTNASTCLRMLAAEPADLEGARETVRRTIRDGHRASEVIKRLRALFSHKPFAAEPVDLNEAAREVVALTAGEMQRSRVLVRLGLTEGLPPVLGDRVQLQQVILNLLLNAADAMRSVEDRPRQLVLRTARDGTEGVLLAVEDAGVGLAGQDPGRLFEAFYTTKPEGMGIGLSVSRSIIERHQGRLWAAPNAGPGATFAFAIPLAPVASVASR